MTRTVDTEQDGMRELPDHSISVLELPDRTRVVVHGELDLERTGEFVGLVRAALEQGPRVEIDLDGVTFLDAAALHGLLACRDDARELRRDLWIGRCSTAVTRLLDVTETASLFRVLPRP